MNHLTAYQIDWLRANMPSFAYVERTTGDVIRNARENVNQYHRQRLTTGKLAPN